MNGMDKARARAAFQASEKVMPLTMALIEAAAEQGANFLELRDACDLAVMAYRDAMDHTSVAFCEFKSKAKAAFEGL